MTPSRKPARLVQRPLFAGVPIQRPAEAVERDVMAAMDSNDYATLPSEITDRFTTDAIRIHDVAGTALFCDRPMLSKPTTVADKATCSMTEETFRGIVKQAMAAGFIAALVKYQQQLAGVPSLSRFYAGTTRGLRQGQESQTKRKVSRADQAMAMVKDGKTVAAIVAHFRANGMPKCQRSTVYRWLKSKPRVRRRPGR
jgi:hypothetical protein